MMTMACTWLRSCGGMRRRGSGKTAVKNMGFSRVSISGMISPEKRDSRSSCCFCAVASSEKRTMSRPRKPMTMLPMFQMFGSMR